MMNEVEPDFLNQLDAVFAQLNPQAVEEFYAAYRQWSLHQRLTELRQRIEVVREQQADNQQRLRETQPAAIALAALARLQSNGVSDIALLDAMLERGESWLDQTMQRLDYFEQFDDFISDDYTKWCQGALEGAFDWIDSLRENQEQDAATQLITPPVEVSSNSEDAGEVEALLLQRLTTEDEQDDLPWQEATTLKRIAIKAPSPETVTTEAEEQEPGDVARQAEETQAHITEYIPQDEPEQSGETSVASDVASSTSPEEVLRVSGSVQPALVESAPTEELSPTESEHYTANEQPTLVEFAAPSDLSPAEETYGQVAEQAAPTEITMPEDSPTTEDTAQSEVSAPDEMGNGASEEAAPHQEQVIASNRTASPAQRVPRKGGLMRRLIRYLAGA